MRPSIIFATAEYVKRLREECLRENKPLHRHTRFRRQELAQDEINPDVLAMSGHIARRCSEQKRVRIPAMKVSEWGHVNATIFNRYLPFSCPLRYFRY
ncbi:hypothetical protein DRE73_20450 [Salmonella enterica subsp. enterica serovar Typhimurium]|nr:hypothetical protein [Salmonella enterica subsp. enterica serovar Typhimurium]